MKSRTEGLKPKVNESKKRFIQFPGNTILVRSALKSMFCFLVFFYCNDLTLLVM